MLPDAITGASADASLTAAQPKDDLGRQDFLRMLVAQLENQDPLNPQDGTEFTAQLAQFSSLEQLIAMRSSIDALTDAESNARSLTESLAAAGLIGRDVLAESDVFELGEGGRVPPLFLELDGVPEGVTVGILNANGVKVRELELEGVPAGRSALAWDGLDDFDQPVEPGVYRLSVGASNAEGLPVTATSLLEARVTGTDLTAGEPRLQVGGLIVSLSDLRQVREAEAVE